MLSKCVARLINLKATVPGLCLSLCCACAFLCVCCNLEKHNNGNTMIHRRRHAFQVRVRVHLLRHGQRHDSRIRQPESRSLGHCIMINLMVLISVLCQALGRLVRTGASPGRPGRPLSRRRAASSPGPRACQSGPTGTTATRRRDRRRGCRAPVHFWCHGEFRRHMGNTAAE